jgi:hypothetical protein
VKYTQILADLADLRDNRFLKDETDVVSVQQVFEDGAVLPGVRPFGRKAEGKEKADPKYSVGWRDATNLLDAVAFLARMFRMLPFNSNLLGVHVKFQQTITSELEKQNKKLEVEKVQQWTPAPAYYGSDEEDDRGDEAEDEEDEEKVELTLDVVCPLGVVACAVTSAQRGLVPDALPPSFGRNARVRHFKNSNRVIRAVRDAYSKNLGEGKVARNPTIQFPLEREIISTTEIIRKTRAADARKSTYEAVLEVLNNECDRFEFSGWLYNLSEATEICPVPVLPCKDSECRST